MEPKADGHQQVQSNELQNQQQQQQQQSQQNGTTAGATAAAAAAASLLTVPPMQNGGGAPPVRKHHSRPGSLSESPLQTPGGQRAGLPRRSPSERRMLEQYVTEHGGDKPFYSVLVANNGLAAVKFMRSVRSWASQALGNARAVSLLAMATPNDMRVSAEHIALADQFVEVPGGSNNNNYANVSLIVQLAERAGVDAVWPGWGHASENPELPAALAQRGIRFLGPHEAAMAALGDKVGSTILAQAAGVPTLPWSGSGVAISFEECEGDIPPELYAKACITDVEDALVRCRNIGYPCMLKASAGGGGKGIRKVNSDEEVRVLFRAVAGEVPGSPIFAMKLAPTSRHLEVQLLCDMHGNVASLFSRDCSVQRRHQKIMEEGPVTAASKEVLAKMEQRARALARSVHYVGAATVEFLYCIEEQTYNFLELNPRLQVEHPVTEGITGVNIPSCQLLIGMGVPLWRIPSIRALYGKDPNGTDAFDPDTTPQKYPDSHVVAVRITSEDAAAGFKPTAGRIDEVHFRPTPEVWGYFSAKSGGGIHEYSDSQFGHLFARGPNREAALRSLVVALRDVVVRGEIRTIVDYASDMLQSPDVINNQLHTGWLDARIAQCVIGPGSQPPWHLAVIAGAVVRAFEHISAQSAAYLGFLTKGHMPPDNVAMSFSDALIIGGKRYPVQVQRRSPTAFCVTLNGCSSVEVTTRKMAGGAFLMQVDGSSHIVHVEEETGGTRLAIDASTCLLEAEADPSKLISASPGKLVRYLAPPGSHIDKGTPYAEVEVMKMLMPLIAPAAGVLCFVAPEGAVLGAGDLIARLELDDPNAVVRAEPFKGGFPDLGPPVVPSQRVDSRLAAAVDAARNVLAGYLQPLDWVMEELVGCLDSPALALLQWNSQLAVARSRLPQNLVTRLEEAVKEHTADVLLWQQQLELEEAAAEEGKPPPAVGGPATGALHHVKVSEFPAAALLKEMQAALQDTPAEERNALLGHLEPLMQLASQHLGGRETYARSVVAGLLDAFLDVEEKFKLTAESGSDKPTTEQEAVDAMRKAHIHEPSCVLEAVISHQGLRHKCDLLSRLLATLVLPAPNLYRSHLRRLAALAGGVQRPAAELAWRGAALLEHSLMGDLRAAVARALSGLDMFSNSSAAAATNPLPGSNGNGKNGGGGLVMDAAAAAAAQATTPVKASGIPRRDTVLEGWYNGLPLSGMMPLGSSPGVPRKSTDGKKSVSRTSSNSLLLSPVASVTPGEGGGAVVPRTSTSLAIEAKMEMLVTVPAAVEEPLASLVVDPAVDPALHARALVTYVRRLYHSFLLREPVLQNHASGLITLAWLFEEPHLRCASPPPSPRAGALVYAPSVQLLPEAILAVRLQLQGLGMDMGQQGSQQTGCISEATVGCCLHVALPGDDGPLQLACEAARVKLRALSGSSTDLTAMADVAAEKNGQKGAQLGESEEDIDAAVRRALTAIVTPHFGAIAAAGFQCLSLLARSGGSGGGDVPVRMGWAWEESTHCFKPDRFLGQVEPISACSLEVSKMAAYRQLTYAPSRNRQWHFYTATERPDAKSYPMRRMFVRGLMRQLGSPALLAASYSGNSGAVANAAVCELEPALVGCLEELGRLQQTASDATAERPDWTHIFCSVLPPLPLPTPPHSTSSPLQAGGLLGNSASRENGDARVAWALRTAVARVVASHINAFRQAAVACLELRFRGPLREPAWRVVASLPSGHEHGEEHVDVYREVYESCPSQNLASHPVPLEDAADPAQALQQQQSTTRIERTRSVVRLVYKAALSADQGEPAAATLQHELRQQIAHARQLPQAPPTTSTFATPAAAQNAAAAADANAGKELVPLLHGQSVLGPYPPLQPLQQRRLAARRHNVTYCYDFPAVFETALREVWAARAAAGEPNAFPPSGRLCVAEELVLSNATGGQRAYRGPCQLERCSRPGGKNDCGMVVWALTLRTPECPQGRQVIAIANDITYASGAFSPREDAVFRAACELALAEKLPLLYLAANSGARVGLATEVKERLQVAWNDPEDPSQGFQYLYLTEADYAALERMAKQTGTELVRAVKQPGSSVEGGARWILQDVVGSEDGLGVECLSGSGAIASAFNRVFREGFSVTLVSGRTVGIGAYLARLGRRCVQRTDQPIILTGFAALNKLLGRQVYTSHMQLGGPRVMGVNGVSHHLAADDLDGVRTMLHLLSFCPPDLGTAAGAPTHPCLPSSDPITRPITYAPGPAEKLDPRAAIAGRPTPQAAAANSSNSLVDKGRGAAAAAAATQDAQAAAAAGAGIAGDGGGAEAEECSWQSGMFDRGSWEESQASWARTVVTGRARLGGQPVGVIAVETGVVSRLQPADPGMPDSSEMLVPQAGQVWYPDSAAKTAAAIEEFALERLPLIILANWRGFSGGQGDLFAGVLQAGSCIVEALRTYRYPVFVYIPCGAELRGGAWVVVDSCISSEGMIEMYADPTARGGVLEPEGVVEIKFRTPDLLRLMHRIDPVIQATKASLQQLPPTPPSIKAAAPSLAAGGSGNGGYDGCASAAVKATRGEAAIKERERALLPVYQQVARAFADMHDTPVRMLAKGVIRGIVPWRRARAFFAQRLRCRLCEETLAAHVVATDPTLTRQDALQLLHGLQSAMPSRSLSSSLPPPASPALGQSMDSLPTASAALADGVDGGKVAASGLQKAMTAFEDLMQADQCFLDWAESAGGRAAMASQLRTLKARAAAAVVSQVLLTADGRDGLLAALGDSLANDPSLCAQLRMLLAAQQGKMN
eukprot:CAMPEP_0202373002 /NCGR_PEP_ID=MMETSP1127-20130417/4091_1 /ASSEMBLY_ACC=CAM_ASM_000462 /TAXON_ID=3047 /ORGANISM="Dunaliella tertiolecta, Strain CCMP1320" /LENGTH=2753 /DNA_ID=CAMNT_0048969731 /DNA_START=204 /DNA_END=8465 /DNA_ORIENTATION=+